MLSNKYINEEPIIFSDQEIARSFIKDAIKLAYVNDLVTEAEINWLKNTADVNKLNNGFVEKEFNSFKETPRSVVGSDFALFSII